MQPERRFNPRRGVNRLCRRGTAWTRAQKEKIMHHKAAMLILFLATFLQASDPNEQDKKDIKEPDKTDVAQQMRDLNSKASPPTNFRVGHVTPRAFDAKAITKTKDGFEIQLPSKAPVPTPTIYKGKI